MHALTQAVRSRLRVELKTALRAELRAELGTEIVDTVTEQLRTSDAAVSPLLPSTARSPRSVPTRRSLPPPAPASGWRRQRQTGYAYDAYGTMHDA